jgi:hypothetical protein
MRSKFVRSALTLAALALSSCGGGGGGGRSGSAIQLVQFDPLGIQANPESNPLAPAAVASGLDSSDLVNVTHGFLSGTNFDRRPVLIGEGPLDVDNSFYLTFTLTPTTPGAGIALTTIVYTYRSYVPGSSGTISLRTSADGFASTVDSKPVVGDTLLGALTFDASHVPVVPGPLEIRLYMHDLLNGEAEGGGFPDFVDWADLVSTNAQDGEGLRVNGAIVPAWFPWPH